MQLQIAPPTNPSAECSAPQQTPVPSAITESAEARLLRLEIALPTNPKARLQEIAHQTAIWEASAVRFTKLRNCGCGELHPKARFQKTAQLRPNRDLLVLFGQIAI